MGKGPYGLNQGRNSPNLIKGKVCQQWVTPCHNLAWEETKFLAPQSNPDNGITLQAQKNRSKATFMQDTSGRNMD